MTTYDPVALFHDDTLGTDEMPMIVGIKIREHGCGVCGGLKEQEWSDGRITCGICGEDMP